MTKCGKCKFYLTLINYNLKQAQTHKSVLMFVFGREEEWSTKTVYGIGAQTVYMLCCLSVCVGVLATVSGQQMVQCPCVTSHSSLLCLAFLLEG